MALYKIEWKKSASKELRNIKNKSEIKKIVKAVETLSRNPFPSKSVKLRGSINSYRIRIGEYRVIYSVQSKILTIHIVRVGHRKEVYRKLL